MKKTNQQATAARITFLQKERWRKRDEEGGVSLNMQKNLIKTIEKYEAKEICHIVVYNGGYSQVIE